MSLSVHRRTASAVAVFAAALLLHACSGDGRAPRDDGTEDRSKLPRLRLLVPAEGLTNGGETVTVVAQNFEDDFTVAAPRVYWGNREVAVNVIDAGAVEVVTPPNPEGAVDVTLIGATSLEQANRAAAFHYRHPELNLEPGSAVMCSAITLRTPEIDGDFRNREFQVFVGGNEAIATGTGYNASHFLVPRMEAGPADVTVVVADTGERITVENGFEVLPGNPPGGD